MRFAERLTGTKHASETRLMAMAAGEPATVHVSACPACQARLAAMHDWASATAGDAAALADEIFTPARLDTQRARIARRLEAAGRSARVIAFPAGSPVAVPSGTGRLVRWAAAAAVGGVMIGFASGRLLIDRDADQPGAAIVASAPAVRAALPSGAASGDVTREELDEEGLLHAAYERVDVDALRTIDDITPRAREVVLNLPRRMP
jgi:hypothetical protein